MSSSVSASLTSCQVVKSVLAIEQAEGVGARVRRSIGTRELRNFTPFLMLDHFRVTQGAGFPDHPHRGMTTLTYMLKGNFLHEDAVGSHGKIGPGDLQFMIAGRGIVHSEIPYIKEGEDPPEGLQLWIDLPADKKMVPPQYQDKKATEIPEANPSEDVSIKVICGEAEGNSAQGTLTSPVRPLGGCWFFDVNLKSPTASVFQKIPKGWNSFLYILDGAVRLGDGSDSLVTAYHTVVMSNKPEEEGILISGATSSARAIVIAGEPLDQPIYQHGPFVMDSAMGIQKAFMDYSFEQNGFENAHSWESKIKELMINPKADVGVTD